MIPGDADVSDTARLLAAVDVARAAVAADAGEGAIGEYIDAVAEDEAAASHYFRAELAGYRGWCWCVVLASAPEGEPTVSEVTLLPGPGALTAPEWVPWAERIRPGDLNPGDLIAAPEDDPRLVPGQVDAGEARAGRRAPVGVATTEPDEVVVPAELGFGRRRQLSREGRRLAATRWQLSDYGPDAAMAQAAAHTCGGCGFYLPVRGELGAAFGVCTNQYAADGHVVSVDYGCGAHSDVTTPAPHERNPYTAFDDGAVEIVGTV